MTENCSQIYRKCTTIVQKSNLCSIPEQHVVIDHPFFCTQRFRQFEKFLNFIIITVISTLIEMKIEMRVSDCKTSQQR